MLHPPYRLIFKLDFRKGVRLMEEYCGWTCKKCCEKYGLTEERIPPKNQYVSCENCLEVHENYEEKKAEGAAL